MLLSKAYAAIQQQLIANVQATGAAAPSFGVGRRDILEQRAQRPHVSWVPIGGPVTLPRAAGGDGKSNPRPLAWRQFATQAFVWADGIDAANELLEHLVAALHAVSHGAYKVTREDWDVSGDLDLGNVVALTFEFGLPFVDETSGTTTVTSTTLTSGFTQG